MLAYFLDTIVDSVPTMCVTALVTLAITLIFKTSFTTNFAQGVISAFGAFVVGTLIGRTGLPVWLAIPIGMLVSMTVAMLVDVVIFRNGRYVNALGKQIITMGLIYIVVNSIPIIFGIEKPIISKFIDGNIEIPVSDGSITITKNSLVCLGLSAVVIAVVFILLQFSKWGLAVRATASNEYVAGMMGINTYVITAISWGLAGAIGTLAAVLLASSGDAISEYFMTNFQVFAFLAGIVGGFSTFHGPVIVGLVIPLANNLVYACAFSLEKAIENQGFEKPGLTGWSMVVVYAIALVIIFFKPQGIFGKKMTRKV